jgi:hypothetical protein
VGLGFGRAGWRRRNDCPSRVCCDLCVRFLSVQDFLFGFGCGGRSLVEKVMRTREAIRENQSLE